MIINVLLLILGIMLLIKGADIFVDGASSTAQNFKVSKVLIGLTIIAFGTSLPELVTTIISSRKGEQDLEDLLFREKLNELTLDVKLSIEKSNENIQKRI